MLRARTILSRDGVEIADVACRHARGRGHVEEEAGLHALVFVRRGCFVRSADGVEALLDPTVAYCMNPGEEQRYDHPLDHGDDCTALILDAHLLLALWGGDPRLPSGPLFTSPEIDVGHRQLLADAGRADPDEVVERAIGLAARTLEQVDARRVAAGRPASARARRLLADGAREALAADANLSLPELARELAVSAHHLSRVFRAVTGHTISRHRIRLRARAAMERLAEGERNLGRLAADLGFADQSHLSHVLRSEAHHTPSVLRRVLASPPVARDAENQ
jgi:AraC-like DNA-binding protein